MVAPIHYHSGDESNLEQIRDLWEALNLHHAAHSPHFQGAFQAGTFSERKAKLRQKYKNGKIRVDIAAAQNCPVGYLISAVLPDGTGEIESLYVDLAFRSRQIGVTLMQRALAWLDAQAVHTKTIAVAVGNETTYNFYAKFGFYPRLTLLQQK